MPIKITPPKEFDNVSNEVWQILVNELNNDHEFTKLCRRYHEAEMIMNGAQAEANNANANNDTARANAARRIVTKYTNKMNEIHRQAIVRLTQFAHWWLKKYGSSKLTLQEVVSILEGTEHDKFVLRANVVMFLADFMEDCFLEMNNCIRSQFPDAAYTPLEDFFSLKKKVSSYINEILDNEGDNFRNLFNEHAASIKMTIYNKVNGFLHANEKRVLEEDENESAESKAIMDKRQLSLMFDYNEKTEEGGTE